MPNLQKSAVNKNRFNTCVRSACDHETEKETNKLLKDSNLVGDGCSRSVPLIVWFIHVFFGQGYQGLCDVFSDL
jgi:hypothetical protein